MHWHVFHATLCKFFSKAQRSSGRSSLLSTFSPHVGHCGQEIEQNFMPKQVKRLSLM